MNNNGFSFILSKISEALAKEDENNFSTIEYLIKAINDKELNAVSKAINSSEFNEKHICDIFDNEESAVKKAIIAGTILLYKNVDDSINITKDWAKEFNNSVDQMSNENEDLPRNYAVLSKYIHEKKTNFYHYVCASIRNRISDNCLIMLKGWSSSTPLINSPNFRNQKFGGGFYIRYNGLGIVVDPGCNFVENMHEHGIYISDIDYVIITHSHIDHYNDMETLATMNYEYNKIIKDRSFPKFKNLQPHKINWLVDGITYDRFKDENVYPRAEHIFKKVNLRKNISIPKTIGSIDAIALEEEIKDTKIKISYFHTIHNCPSSFGFKLELSEMRNKQNNVVIGYTSDTAFFDKLSNNLEKCDILISNISELCENDLLKKTVESDFHLRLQGCINLVEKMDAIPKLYIISEFWGGKEDIRLFIVNTLIDRFNNTVFKSKKTYNPKVLAGDVGLTINLENLDTKCSFCKDYSRTDMINTILTGPYERLKYVCDNCYSSLKS